MSIAIRYTNALHKYGLGSDEARAIDSEVRKLPPGQRKIELGRLRTLDVLFINMDGLLGIHSKVG